MSKWTIIHFQLLRKSNYLRDDLLFPNIFVEDMLDMLDVYQDDDKNHSVSGLSISDYVRNTIYRSRVFQVYMGKYGNQAVK